MEYMGISQKRGVIKYVISNFIVNRCIYSTDEKTRIIAVVFNISRKTTVKPLYLTVVHRSFKYDSIH